jgi:HTH-type transcriptional regulator / antitoxin HigA
MIERGGKVIARAKTAFDIKRYGKLISKVAPKVIETEEEYDRLMAEFERLFNKPDLTPEENAIYELLVMLIENYEEKHYALNVSSPLSILKSLMEEHDLKPKDLWDLFGSKGVTSEIFSGKRGISKAQAVKLGERFNVSPSLFLGID